MGWMSKMGDKIKSWLGFEPAKAQRIIIQEPTSFETAVMEYKIWYRGDASELNQFFKALKTLDGFTGERFWAAAPDTGDIRKAHLGLPGLIADTLAYIVKSDMNDVEFEGDKRGNISTRWQEIAEEIDFAELVGDAVKGTLITSDGAFKLSYDSNISKHPLVEFWGADKVRYIRRHGRIIGTVFISWHTQGDEVYRLEETYLCKDGKGQVTYKLVNAKEVEVPLARVDALKGLKPISYDTDLPLAIPFFVYKSTKWAGRGKSIFDGKTDAFDGLDEVISQWIDAVRAGRVLSYIPETLLPRDTKTGVVLQPSNFGQTYITTQQEILEGVLPKVEQIQATINYEAFYNSYCAMLDMSLYGLISPATLGIDVGKMSSAEAQREKKDITGYTRNTITDALEKTLPKLITSILALDDAVQGRESEPCEPIVTFGEYGAPDFDSKVATLSTASTSNLMSVEAQVEELWGASKEDKWKEEEVLRILREKGIEEVPEPAIGAEDV